MWMSVYGFDASRQYVVALIDHHGQRTGNGGGSKGPAPQNTPIKDRLESGGHPWVQLSRQQYRLDARLPHADF